MTNPVSALLEDLADEFWIAVHFATRRYCTGYVAKSASEPQSAHEMALLGCVTRVIGARYVTRALAFDCPPAVFLQVLEERRGLIYNQRERSYDPET